MSPRREDGAVAVEFAAVGLLLTVLLYALVVYGLVFAMKITMTSAAEQSARSAIRAETHQEAVELAELRAAEVLGWLGPDTLANTAFDFQVAPCADDPDVNCLHLVVVYPYADHPILPILPGLGVALPEVIQSQAVVQLRS